MRISDWSSDVCSSDLATIVWRSEALAGCRFDRPLARAALSAAQLRNPLPQDVDPAGVAAGSEMLADRLRRLRQERGLSRVELSNRTGFSKPSIWAWERSEEHTSELQSIMRISYAVFCLKKKKSKASEHNNILNNNTT